MSANIPKSGYERGVLLELRLARTAAWLLFLAIPVVIVLDLIGTLDISNWHCAFVAFVLFLTASWSGKCEYRAEAQLKEIWSAEQTERLVS